MRHSPTTATQALQRTGQTTKENSRRIFCHTTNILLFQVYSKRNHMQGSGYFCGSADLPAPYRCPAVQLRSDIRGKPFQVDYRMTGKHLRQAISQAADKALARPLIKLKLKSKRIIADTFECQRNIIRTIGCIPVKGIEKLIRTIRREQRR